jgi:hypothetical protein
MAELNRQVLINLHSDANTPSAEILLHGELAVMHSNITAATIYTKTTDGQVAKFITDKAVDAKIKPVADDLAAHKTAYGVKMTELENADAENAAAISAETQARVSADTALDGRLTKVENLLGDGDTEGSILDRLGDVEAVASANTAAIQKEAEDRAEEDGKIRTDLENHDTRITAAQKQADKGVADAAAALEHSQGVAVDLTTTAAAIRKEFADADAALMGKDTDAAGDATIKGALKAAASAQTAADAAQAQADKGVADAAAAQATANDAKGKIDTFLANADLTEQAIDTLKEIQTYITEDGEAAADMLEAIDANAKAAAAAQAKADAAQTYAEGVAANLTKEIERATSAETALNAAITAETAAREAADAGLLGASGDAVSAVTIWGVKNAAAAAQAKAEQGVADAAAAKTAAENAQTTANQGVADAANALKYAKQVETDYKAADQAMDAAYKAADAKLLGASGDAASAVTIWGAKNAAAAAQKSADDANDAVEDLEAVTVKAGEIVGVGAEGKSTIVGTFANNKLTFDFGQLVIDCGTF